jgi:hypothetical protein
LVTALYAACASEEPEEPGGPPVFTLAQEGLFETPRALTNAIADFDGDQDLDLFVGFNGLPNRLYRNDGGTFVDVAQSVGLADSQVTRSAAWGDFDNDGFVDLFVAFVSGDASSNKLYRNDRGRRFVDVTVETGVGTTGSFRQVSWVDFDNDNDLDLFIGMRDRANALYRNDDGQFHDVAVALGVGDERRTVGAAWFDFDRDGDLDLVVANMDGDANGIFRNDGRSFVDVASDLGLADGGRALNDPASGSVRPTLDDFDNDGHIDILWANYGPTGLFVIRDSTAYANAAQAAGIAIDSRYDAGTWGDYDNDGRLDLYINGTVTGGQSYRDYLFHNEGDRLVDLTPSIIRDQEADHGAHWADFDGDGDLDLALTGATPEGMHYLLWNGLDAERAGRSLQVAVVDDQGHYTRAGAEVRIYEAGTDRLLGTRIVDTGSGYNSQNAMPVHFGLGAVETVDVEVTTFTASGRATARRTGVDRADYAGTWLILRVNAEGQLVDEG